VKLGEIPGGQNAKPVRLIEPGYPKQTAERLEKLRAAWPSTGGNPLIIKGPPPKKPEATTKPEAQKNEAEKKKDEQPTTQPAASQPAATPPVDRATSNGTPLRVSARYVQLDAAAAAPSANSANEAATSPKPTESTPKAGDAADGGAAQNQPAPVTVTVTEDGRIMLSSPDTAALDRL
jgi:hypothetical protein